MRNLSFNMFLPDFNYKRNSKTFYSCGVTYIWWQILFLCFPAVCPPSKRCIHFQMFSFFYFFYSERGARAWGPHGEWKAKKDPQAEDDLFQLPARCTAEALPEGAVPRPARASRAGSSAWPYSDTGEQAWPGVCVCVCFRAIILSILCETELFKTTIKLLCAVRPCVITHNRRRYPSPLGLINFNYILLLIYTSIQLGLD